MYYGDGLNYYHNYNNITNMDMYSIVNINEAPYGNSIYLKDKIISDDKMKKHKRKVKSIDENLNQFLGLNNNFNIPNNRINYNYGMVQRNNSGLNNHISTNIKNDKQYRMYKNKNIFKENSTILNDKNNNIPYTYQRMYPKEKPNVTNNNYLNRNINNPNLNRGKLTLNNKKNLINKNNINIPVNINNNNKRQTYYLNQNRQNNQFQNNMNIQNEFNQRKVGVNVNNFLNNNKINININKNKKVNNNLVNNHETPNNILNSFKNYNNNNNQNNINKNTIKQKKDVINQIQQNKKRKIIENEQEEDDENFNDLVDDLYNFALKNKQKKKHKNKIPLNNIFQNNNKNKEDENVINNSIQLNIPPNRNKKQEYAECACQAEISKNSTHNSLKNENSVKKNEKIDISIGIQESLLPMIQPNSFNDNEIQADIDKKIELKINHVNIINIINDKKQEIKEENEIKEKDFSLNNINYNNLNDDKDKEKSKEEYINNEDIKQDKEEDNKNNNKGINNENEVALNNLNDLCGSIIKISQDIVIVNNQDDLKIGEEYDDSDDNKEEEKINKKRVAINLDNNFYYTFVKNDLIDLCQVRKGIKGSLEFFQPKTLEDDFDSHIVIQRRACIKPFKKNEIKIDENYQLRENMDEMQIVPELYDDFEEGNEINENETQELASSLRGSIDKSTDININNSIKRSINQSYNQSMVGSLLMSTNNEGEGIIRKLKAAFEESVNREF